MRREALLQQLEHIKKVYRDVLRKQKLHWKTNLLNYMSKSILPHTFIFN